MLADDPRVVPVNEPLIGMYLSPFLSDQPGWTYEELDAGKFTMRQVQASKPHQFFAAEFADVVDPGLGRLLRDRFLAQVVRYPPEAPLSKAVAVVKEPAGSQSADLISKALPRSRLLFLARDGRDVVDSALAANLAGGWATRDFPGAKGVDEARRLDFVAEQAHKWLWRTEMVQAAIASHPGPTLTLRDADLLADPADRLAEVFDFLGLAVDGAAVSRIVTDHAFDSIAADKRGSEQFYGAATPGLWRENLNEDERETVNRILGPTLAALGYEAG
jgi:hypothetical protein